jgi:4a-hydroxytetrahydrobiopterin dehydratase
MSSARKLTQEELDDALAELDGWAIEAGKLSKQFRFANFARAMGWMVSVGIVADKMNHHPEWTNVYNRVTVNLSTHDLDDAISNLDVKLASHMDAMAA